MGKKPGAPGPQSQNGKAAAGGHIGPQWAFGLEVPADGWVPGVEVLVPVNLADFLIASAPRAADPAPTLTVWFDHAASLWKVVLHARHQRCSCFHSSATLGDLLLGLGQRLARETARWRADKDVTPK